MMLKLAETFTSIQGEGHLTGKRMFFIRFGGCTVSQCFMHPVNTNTCDTAWKPKAKLDKEGIDALVGEALKEVGVGGWVSVTGGEPTDQAQSMNYLIGELRGKGMQVNIQTAGLKIIPCPWDWLTVSPKGTLEETKQDFGQELKIVYTGQSLDELEQWFKGTKFWNYYLMPYWKDGKSNVEETVEAVHKCFEQGLRFELTQQTHKWANVR